MQLLKKKKTTNELMDTAAEGKPSNYGSIFFIGTWLTSAVSDSVVFIGISFYFYLISGVTMENNLKCEPI